MIKTLTLFLAGELFFLGALHAQRVGSGSPKDVIKRQVVELITGFEADFSETFDDYVKLQGDFVRQAKRPSLPDQSKALEDLKNQFELLKVQFIDDQRKEGGASEILIERFLALRGQLYRERTALLVAKAQVAQSSRLQNQDSVQEKQLLEQKRQDPELSGQVSPRVQKQARVSEPARITEQTTEANRLESSIEPNGISQDPEANPNAVSTQLRSAQEAVIIAEKIKADYVALTARNDQLKQENTTLHSELAAKGKELAQVKAQLAEMKAAAVDSSALARLEQEKRDLVEQLENREGELKKARTELGKLHLRSEILQKEFVALQRRCLQIAPICYEKGVEDLPSQQQRVLSQILEVLAVFPSARFEIVGHTCDLGSKENNLALSRNRARSLHDYLLANDIPAERLSSRGVADAQPIAPNDDEENRRKNRRVEIEILD